MTLAFNGLCDARLGKVQHLASVQKELVWVSNDTQKTAACPKPMGVGMEVPRRCSR